MFLLTLALSLKAVLAVPPTNPFTQKALGHLPQPEAVSSQRSWTLAGTFLVMHLLSLAEGHPSSKQSLEIKAN